MSLLLFVLFLFVCILYILLNPFPPKKVIVEGWYEKRRREYWEERKRRKLQSEASKKETALIQEKDRVKRKAHAERTRRNALRKEEARLEYSLRTWGRLPPQWP